jgi:hypothetical protein
MSRMLDAPAQTCICTEVDVPNMKMLAKGHYFCKK